MGSGHTADLDAAPPRSDLRTWIWGLVAVGVVLRLRVFLFNRSLWLDELFLYANLDGSDLLRFLEPLGEGQVAAPLFVLAVQLVTRLLGEGELALRLPALLASCAALPLAARVGRRVLDPPGCLFLVAALALSPNAIRYAAELKPYSVDLLVALVLADRALALIADAGCRRAWVLALLGAVAIGLSIPAPFALVGVGIAILARFPGWTSRRRAGAVAMGAVWLGVAWVTYFGVLAKHHHDEHIHRYWVDMAAFPGGWQDVPRWTLSGLARALADPAPFGTAWGHAQVVSYLAVGLFLAGAASLIRRRPVAAAVLLSPIVATWTAATLEAYPFAGRVLTFLSVSLIVPVASALDRIASRPARGRLVAGVFAAILLALPAGISAVRLVRPLHGEETRDAVRHLAESIEPDDEVAVYWWTRLAWRYYAPRFGLDRGDAFVIPFIYDEDAWRYADEVDRHVGGEPRVWLMMSHFYPPGDEHLMVLGHLEDAGAVVLERFTAPSAAAFLLDLTELRPERGGRGR